MFDTLNDNCIRNDNLYYWKYKVKFLLIGLVVK